jgi:Na+-transporting NADH:ubiquinone oxidoreductase subunit NqrF
MALFYGMATIKDLVFHQELLNLASTYKNFDYYPILSPGAEGWNGDTGYINLDYILGKIKINEKSHFYFCGPPIMTDSISESLLANGHDQDYLHSEKFASPVSFDLSNIPERKAIVKINNKTMDYFGKDSLLEFMEYNDVDINFACRSGVCGECKCKIKSGEVDSITDSGLTALEKKEGYILTCVSRPLTDIELEV